MIKAVLERHKLKFSLTLFLLLAEALAGLLFPLVIGFAIDGTINGSYGGIWQLLTLGIVVLLVGAGRRFFDSRFYAQVYQEVGFDTISCTKDDSASIKSARLGMIGELVEFFENSMPELINSAVGLVGVVVIIATLNVYVFCGSLCVTVLVFLIYWISSGRTVRLNKAANDEQERQVDVVSRQQTEEMADHLKKGMKWNIQLSDLETANFSASWVLLLTFLVITILLGANSESLGYGALFSLLMYVFQFMESMIDLPFFYQNWLRLKEIRVRLR